MLLGTFTMAPGAGHRIELLDDANGVLVADAVHVAPPRSVESFVWTPTVPTPGDYEIFARWTSAADRATDATYTIAHAAGVATVAVNQRQNGGLWVSLGAYPLDAGTANTISLENSPTGTVVADAIRIIGGAGGGGAISPPSTATVSARPGR